jgi:hypothetical protein
MDPLDMDPPDMTCAARQFTQIGLDMETTRSTLTARVGEDAMMNQAELAYAVMVNKMRDNLDRLYSALNMIGTGAESTGHVVEWADEGSIIHDGHKRPWAYGQLGPD